MCVRRSHTHTHKHIHRSQHYENPPDMQAFNTAAQKLAVRGVTFLASTGDDGEGARVLFDRVFRARLTCALLLVVWKGVANQRARQDDGFCGFYPSFPATSPYVLAVG